MVLVMLTKEACRRLHTSWHLGLHHDGDLRASLPKQATVYFYSKNKPEVLSLLITV